MRTRHVSRDSSLIISRVTINTHLVYHTLQHWPNDKLLLAPVGLHDGLFLEVSEAPSRPPLSRTKLTLLVISGHLVISLQLPDNGGVMGSV